MSLGLFYSSIQTPILSKLAPSLPPSSGPFQVGFCDFEYQSSTPIESPIQNLGNISLRLFYPTSTRQAENPLKRPLWYSHPKYLRGYLNFVGIPETLGFPAIYLLFGRVRIPCTEWADLADFKVPNDPLSTPFPILFFSHGLGGTRTTYSHICYEFASYGFVVASFEHLDGSASVAFSNGGKKKIPYMRDLGPRFGKNGRQYQLNYRVGEITKCMEFLSALQNGNNEIRIYNPDRANFTPLNQCKARSPLRILAQQFKGRLDLSSSYLSGHSFGATTSIEAAYQFTRNHFEFPAHFQIKAVLAFDPWMALAGEHLFLEPLSRPTLVVNTHLFQDQISIRKLHRLFRIETADIHDFAEKESKMLTILNAGHQAQSDIAVLLPARLQRLPGVREMVGTLDPEITLKLTTQACREYLRPYLPIQWRDQISSESSIFHLDPRDRPKEVILGASLYGSE